MAERYVIMAANQVDANPYSYPVADEDDSFDVLVGVNALEQLVKCLYDKKKYQATLCDPRPDSRTYNIVGWLGTEKGAIYKLIERL